MLLRSHRAAGRIHRLRAAAAALSLLVACSPDADVAAKPTPGDADIVPGATVTGNYLAARHAQSLGDAGGAASFLMAALAKSPGDAVLLGRAYLALTLDGNVDEAVDVARRYVQAGGEGALAPIVIGIGDMHAGRFADAVARLEAVPQSPLSVFLVPVLRAWAELGAGKKEAALAALEPLRTNPPTQALYEVHAAWISDVAGDSQAALAHARAAVKAQDEPWLRLAQLAGGIFERAGEREEAEKLYKAYVDQHPDSETLTGTLARLAAGKPAPKQIATARDGAAEALFDGAGILSRQNGQETALALGRLGLYLRPSFPALQLLVGDMLENDERWEEADRIYEAVDRTSPLRPTAEIGIARNLDRMGKFDDAQAMLRRMAAERPHDSEPPAELADMLRRRERFAEAVVAYDEAFARIGDLQPRHWRLLYARGIALERAGQWSRAEDDFKKALEFEPDQPFVLNYLGYSWVEQGENLEQAEEMIRKAAALQPNDGYILDSLGWVYFRLGRLPEAVDNLEQAVELRPEDAEINDHLGDAYWAIGRQREARFQWQAALDAKPESKLKAELERKLEQGPVRAANAEPQ